MSDIIRKLPHVPFITSAQVKAAFPHCVDPKHAIAYAIDKCDGCYDGMGFLEAWREGDFVGINNHWPLYLKGCAE